MNKKVLTTIGVVAILALIALITFLVVRSQSEKKTESTIQQTEIIIFHNDTGPMCIVALKFFEDKNLEITEHLTNDDDFSELLNAEIDRFNGVSQGVSSDFGYYPIIIIKDKAYSGFDDEIKIDILNQLK